MSLLESMRSGTDSTWMQVVLAAIVVSFVFWGVGGQGDKTAAVATVNGVPIMDTDYLRRLRLSEARLNRALSEAEEASLRQTVKQQMIEEEVLQQEAEVLGLVVSDTEVARAIFDDPAFQDDDGAFSERLYRNRLKRMGRSRADYEEGLRDDILRFKLRNLVYLGATVSEPMLKAAYVEENTHFDVQYVRLRASQFTDDVEIDLAQRESWMADHKADIEDAYKADFDRLYDLPEKVTLSTITLRLMEDGLGVAELKPRLEAVQAELAAGADFATLARTHSEDRYAVDGGANPQMALGDLSETIKGAVADLEAGQLTDVLVTDDGVTLVRLDAREPARVIELAEVEGDIADRLIRENEAPVLQASFAEKVLAAWKESGSIPQTLLDEQGILPLTTGLVGPNDEQGLFSPPEKMMRQAADAAEGDVLPEVYQNDGALWVGQVTRYQAADLTLFEDEKDLVRDRVLYQRRAEFYEAWVQDAVARAKVD